MRSPLLALSLAALTLPAFAASFDCKLAKTPREKTICASSELSKADSDLAAKYKALRAELSPAAAMGVQSDQRAWLAYLDKACSPTLRAERRNTTDCLVGEYNTRNDDLGAIKLSSGQLIYTRATNLALPSKDADDPFHVDPGVGIGNYAWPQIDKPDTSQAAFNSAATTYVIAGNDTSDHPHPKTLREGTDLHVSQQVTWALGPTNDHWTTIYFERFFMAYGGAHPETFDTSFIWNNEAGRQLQSSDVFDDAKGWKTKLPAAINAKLHADSDRGPYLSDKEWLAKGIVSGLANTHEWTLDSHGLTITFGQYEVAAYAAGMPEVHFTWQELKPYLSANFDRTKLPAPYPRAND
ncbi:DUF3298 domain-containing protein [Granulicella cerasi]|uniref:DUF3298 domain-containing protein n=1 Tax=Granulicella cerasi TaxID=741063 RepID=A0ABW1Z373_9BACT|nr:DUF3298 domain-containing protein [Granulicella cerasi]